MKYESAISPTHINIAMKYNMSIKQTLIFGWWCSISEVNNEYHNVEYQEWFKQFLKENHLFEKPTA